MNHDRNALNQFARNGRTRCAADEEEGAMNDPGQEAWPILAKLAGALAGALISLVYLVPKSGREAVSRFVTGLVSGLVFGGATGMALAERLGVFALLTRPEILLMGSAAASLTAWWALGILARIADRYAGPDGR